MASFGTNDKVVWTVTSYHGNTVSLYQEDLDHLLEHPEMVGQENRLKEAIQRPTLVREGWNAQSCVFETPCATNPEGIRVVVEHTRENFVQGGCEGDVKTAYFVQSAKYTRAHVGDVIPKDRGGV